MLYPNLQSLLLLFALTSGILCAGCTAKTAQSPAASNADPSSFDAVYAVCTDMSHLIPANAGPEFLPQSVASEVRETWDGRGRLRTESLSTHGNAYTVIDYTKGISSDVEHDRHVIRQRKITYTPLLTRETIAENKDCTPVGTKTIAAHSTHGWRKETPKGAITVWIADDLNCPVESNSELPQGYTSSRILKRFNGRTVDPALFELPKDYRVQEYVVP